MYKWDTNRYLKAGTYRWVMFFRNGCHASTVDLVRLHLGVVPWWCFHHQDTEKHTHEHSHPMIQHREGSDPAPVSALRQCSWIHPLRSSEIELNPSQFQPWATMDDVLKVLYGKVMSKYLEREVKIDVADVKADPLADYREWMRVRAKKSTEQHLSRSLYHISPLLMT